jgi:non-specific serine/threonine protein kinase/serine/threonine-protein kinase
MGEVWLAEQKEPVRRRVAIKLIKAGMDTREVVARFEAERQALALMDHPAIAKVFDAGSTPQGRPYFVMEYRHSHHGLLRSAQADDPPAPGAVCTGV